MEKGSTRLPSQRAAAETSNFTDHGFGEKCHPRNEWEITHFWRDGNVRTDGSGPQGAAQRPAACQRPLPAAADSAGLGAADRVLLTSPAAQLPLLLPAWPALLLSP